jgi:hypothetical protein
VCCALQEKKDSLDREKLVAGNEEPKDQRRKAETPEQGSSPPEQTAEPSDHSVVLQEHTRRLQP